LKLLFDQKILSIGFDHAARTVRRWRTGEFGILSVT
jgi:hypothetical protein